MADIPNQELVTEQGYLEMQKELERLTTVERENVIERLRIARGYGDLSENAEYDEAKNAQSILEGKIKELEQRIKNAKIVKNDQISTETVSIGTTVRVYDLGFEEEIEYKIVGASEADVRKGKLSNESPVGQGLIGHKVGEIITVKVPMGEAKYRIEDIRR